MTGRSDTHFRALAQLQKPKQKRLCGWPRVGLNLTYRLLV
jgi:hypothetical protein